MRRINRERARWLYLAGVPVKDIARELGCHPEAIYNNGILKGVPRRGQTQRRTETEMVESIRRAYLDEGLSAAACARRFGVSDRTVRRLLGKDVRPPKTFDAELIAEVRNAHALGTPILELARVTRVTAKTIRRWVTNR